jgi:16S rRNA (guanine(527)-N(7))-methyltransferase RsmG
MNEQGILHLEEYIRELFRWNRRIRLVGVQDPDLFRSQHLSEVLSSLRDIEELSWTTAVDIGSGNGLIAVPLACAIPHRQVVALEPQARKCTFLRHIARHLQLDNLEVAGCRLEDYSPSSAVAADLLWAARSVEIPHETFRQALQKYPGAHFCLYTGEKTKSHALVQDDVKWLKIIRRRRLSTNPIRFSVLAIVR